MDERVDPADGMRKLQDAMRKLVRVPKEEIDRKIAAERAENAAHAAKRAARRAPAKA